MQGGRIKRIFKDADTDVDLERKKYIGLIKEALAESNDYAAMCWLAEYGAKAYKQGHEHMAARIIKLANEWK
jgi:hypothetical protein